MSWQASAYVAGIFAETGITRSEKLVMLILANHHNPDSGRCDASIPTLARESLLKERRLQTVLGALESKGFIRIERRSGHSNQYWFSALTPAKTAGVPTPAVSRATPAVFDARGAVPDHGNRKIEPKTERATTTARGKDERVARAFTAYENCVGTITPTVAGDIGDWLDRHADADRWIEAACAEAERSNARRWSFIETILKRYEREGFGPRRAPSRIQAGPRRTAADVRRGAGGARRIR